MELLMPAFIMSYNPLTSILSHEGRGSQEYLANRTLLLQSSIVNKSMHVPIWSGGFDVFDFVDEVLLAVAYLAAVAFAALFLE